MIFISAHKIKISENISVILMIGVLFTITSCYQKQEGCLDIRATNFDLDADIPCEDCCEYPDLRLKFLHREVLPDTINNIGYADSVYFDGAANAFRINSLKYYVSNIRLLASDGSEAAVNETIDIATPNGIITFIDDFLLVNGSLGSALTAGSFSTIKTFDKIRIFVGLDSDLQSVDPTTLPDDHVLAINQDTSMYDIQNGMYFLGNHEIFRDTTAIDTVPRSVAIPMFYGPVELTLDFPEAVSLPEGFDMEITLQVNVPDWFATSDVRLISDQQLFTNIVSKMSETFSVVDVSVDN
jgi:hypothetical protein